MPRRSALVLNPTLQLTAIADVSRRGRGRARIPIVDGDAVRLVLAALTGGRAAAPAAVRRELAAAGILLRPGSEPREVNLDPRLPVVRHAGPPMSEPLSVARGCCIMRGPALPAGVARRTRSSEAFLPAVDILWVADRDSGLTLPYTLTPALARSVRTLLDRPAAAGSLRRLARRLRAIGALATTGDAADRAQRWQRRVREWRRDLRSTGFVALRELMAPSLRDALRRYYRALEREGYLYGGDARAQGLPLLQGEPVLEFLAGQLGSVVRQVTREAVDSSFTPYLRVYDPGAVLDRHRDQPVCRWTVDLIVGGDPAPARASAWPLWMATRGRTRAVRLGLGDAVLYRGTDVDHWRRRHPARATTAVASLHYGDPPRA
jgi:hypothetical protein